MSFVGRRAGEMTWSLRYRANDSPHYAEDNYNDVQVAVAGIDTGRHTGGGCDHRKVVGGVR